MNTTRNLQSVCCCEFYIMFDIQLLLVLDLPKIFCHVGFSINGTKPADHPGGLSIVNLSSLGHWLEKPTGWVVYNGKSMSVKQFSMFPLFTVKSKPIFHLWNPPCCSLFISFWDPFTATHQALKSEILQAVRHEQEAPRGSAPGQPAPEDLALSHVHLKMGGRTATTSGIFWVEFVDACWKNGSLN